MMSKNILISGGSGLVGSALAEFLRNKGYNVASLTRNKDDNDPYSFYWDYTKVPGHWPPGRARHSEDRPARRPTHFR